MTLKWTWCKVIGSTVAAVLELAQKPRRPPRGRILHFQATLFLCAVQAFWRNTIKWMYRTQGKGSTHDALYKYLYAVWHKLQKGFILCCANAAPQDSRRSQAIDLLQKPVGQFPLLYSLIANMRSINLQHMWFLVYDTWKLSLALG